MSFDPKAWKVESRPEWNDAPIPPQLIRNWLVLDGVRFSEGYGAVDIDGEHSIPVEHAAVAWWVGMGFPCRKPAQ